MIIEHQTTVNRIRHIILENFKYIISIFAGVCVMFLIHNFNFNIFLLIGITIIIIYIFSKKIPYKIVYDTEKNLIIIEYYKFLFLKKVLEFNDKEIIYVYMRVLLHYEYRLLLGDNKDNHICIIDRDLAPDGKAKLDEIVFYFKENGVKEKIGAVPKSMRVDVGNV